MPAQRLAELLQGDTVVIDGGLASELEARGHDLSGSLWSARLLRDEPEEIVAVHRSYIDAGARIIVSASYQASRVGLGDDADLLLQRSVQLAREAVGASSESVLVAASVGPYGAVLGDGSEYRGNYELSRAELSSFHQQRIEVLLAAEPDLLAIETIPDVVEAEVLVELLARLGKPDAWMTFSAADARSVCAGQPMTDAAAVASEAVLALGVNCTAPQYVSGLLAAARSVSELPLVAYPNAGQVWDGADEVWRGAPSFEVEELRSWSQQAALLGGCCGVGPAAISELARRLQPGT